MEYIVGYSEYIIQSRHAISMRLLFHAAMGQNGVPQSMIIFDNLYRFMSNKDRFSLGFFPGLLHGSHISTFFRVC